MTGMPKIIPLLTLLAALLAPVSSYPEDTAVQPEKYVRGRITDINFAGSKLTIQWFYTTEKISRDKLTFYLPDGVAVYTDKSPIFRYYRRTQVTDLVEGDHVIVKYRENGGKKRLEAINIKVMEHDRPIPP